VHQAHRCARAVFLHAALRSPFELAAKQLAGFPRPTLDARLGLHFAGGDQRRERLWCVLRLHMPVARGEAMKASSQARLMHGGTSILIDAPPPFPVPIRVVCHSKKGGRLQARSADDHCRPLDAARHVSFTEQTKLFHQFRVHLQIRTNARRQTNNRPPGVALSNLYPPFRRGS
jgi:hypothetical protein